MASDIVSALFISNPAGQFIVLCWLLFLGYFLVSAFFTKRTAEYYGFGLWPRLALFVFLVVIAAALKYYGELSAVVQAIGVPLWQNTPAIGLLADALTLIGLAIAVWARYTLGGNWSGAVTFKVRHELVTNGPYDYVRHPLYLGLLTLALATAIYIGFLAAFLVFFAAAIGLAFKAGQEEGLMTKHFPKEYSEYKGRTKAIIPFLF